MIKSPRKTRVPSEAPVTHKSVLKDAARANAIEALSTALRQLMWQERMWLKAVLADYDLDISPWMILLQLKKNNGVCSMGELAQALEQPNATTTGHVDRLVEKGLVVREGGDEHDRRKVNVRLTEQGTTLCLRIVQARLLKLSRAAARFEDDDLQNLTHLLQMYVQELERQTR